MDRSILEGDPHSVIEGMTIAAYGIGASEGYVYCRAEYPLAIERLHLAIKQAHEYGLMGQNILGSDFSFELKVKEGAGALSAAKTLLPNRRQAGRTTPAPAVPGSSRPVGQAHQQQQRQSYAIVHRLLLTALNGSPVLAHPRAALPSLLDGKVNNTGLVEVAMYMISVASPGTKPKPYRPAAR